MRYGAMEAAAFGDLLDTLSREEIIQNAVTGLNLAYLRGAADAFASLGKEARNKVEAILAKDIDDLENPINNAVAGVMLAYQMVHEECVRQYDKATATMNETPRDNAQIEGATAPQVEGSSIPVPKLLVDHRTGE